MHRARRCIRPISMCLLPFTPFQQLCEVAEFIGRIAIFPRIMSSTPIEESLVDRLRARGKSPDERASDLSVVASPENSEAAEQCTGQRFLEAADPVSQYRWKGWRVGDYRKTSGELRQIPVDGLGLATECVEAVMIEIGGGELMVPIGREAPWAVIKALASHVDIV